MSDIAPGLADPAHDSQSLFRAILDAFSHPGRSVSLRQAPERVGRLSRSAVAFLLTLVDRDTPLWLDPVLAEPVVSSFVRFHTGAPIVDRREDALFAIMTPECEALFDGFTIGTDPYPDRSATLLIELPSLSGGPERLWRGPGIADATAVALAGLSDSFWADWNANRMLFPCGVDVAFAAGSEFIALPRSVAVESPPCT